MRQRITVEIDERLLRDIDTIARRVGFSRDETLERMALRWFAERDARRGTGEILVEFGRDMEMLELYWILRRHLQWERAKNLPREAAPPPAVTEAPGLKIERGSDEELGELERDEDES